MQESHDFYQSHNGRLQMELTATEREREKERGKDNRSRGFKILLLSVLVYKLILLIHTRITYSASLSVYRNFQINYLWRLMHKKVTGIHSSPAGTFICLFLRGSFLQECTFPFHAPLNKQLCSQNFYFMLLLNSNNPCLPFLSKLWFFLLCEKTKAVLCCYWLVHGVDQILSGFRGYKVVGKFWVFGWIPMHIADEAIKSALRDVTGVGVVVLVEAKS